MIVVARHLASATIGFAEKLEGRFQLRLEGHGLGLGDGGLPRLRRAARLEHLAPAAAVRALGRGLGQLRVAAGGARPPAAAAVLVLLDPHGEHHPLARPRHGAGF